MNFNVVIIIFTCIILHGMTASPVKKSKETSDKISKNQNKEKIQQIEFDVIMNDYSIGSIFNKVASWFGYSGATNSDITTEIYLWPGAQIPVIIDEYFVDAEYQFIMDAINDFHQYTCIRFVPHNGEEAHIRIIPSGDGCHSSLGYTGSDYDVHLQTASCVNKGTAMHELMHVIGFIHEQSRHDRDDYVNIQWDNIKYGAEINFRKFQNTYVNDYGLPYDFGSIMHYQDDAFSGNGGKSIIPKIDLNVDMGQRNGFSLYDIDKINRMYQC